MDTHSHRLGAHTKLIDSSCFKHICVDWLSSTALNQSMVIKATMFALARGSVQVKHIFLASFSHLSFVTHSIHCRIEFIFILATINRNRRDGISDSFPIPDTAKNKAPNSMVLLTNRMGHWLLLRTIVRIWINYAQRKTSKSLRKQSWRDTPVARYFYQGWTT